MHANQLETVWAPRALALLRIVTAVLFMEHGAQKLLGFPPLPEGRSMPELFTLIWFAGFLELVGGFLMLIGFLTRPVAFILSGEMAVAYWMAHAPGSFYPALNGGDAAILFCFIFLYFAAAGPGAFSVDGARANQHAA
jgi:putative oxidoreductase